MDFGGLLVRGDQHVLHMKGGGPLMVTGKDRWRLALKVDRVLE